MLTDRVAVITGAGNGIGAEHARLFASLGAHVVVNDIEPENAERVAAEVGGLANSDDIADFEGARRLIAAAVSEYGRLDVLVNNAGVLRDAFFHRMTEEEWDTIVRVHLKGHFAPLRHAADHWRARSKAGEEVNGAVVNTTSASGTFLANPGQANYGTAKAAIAALTLIASAELGRIGVRVNAIAPVARTRLTENVPGMIGELMKQPEFDPRHVSPLVAYLAGADCPLTGKVFSVQGGAIAELHGWTAGETIRHDGDWTVDVIAEKLGGGVTLGT
jgi:NAD(P)-dependent dehydrogenase (short-subunit alcohol dehydrogenase family)